MSELNLMVAESKVTYEEIKDYVLKQSGLKVSNLYIAQVKQKCGIIERDSLSADEKSPVNQRFSQNGNVETDLSRGKIFGTVNIHLGERDAFSQKNIFCQR